MPYVSNLVKKTNYNTKIVEIKTKVSSLDGEIYKNKFIGNKLSFWIGTRAFDTRDGFYISTNTQIC